MKLEHFRRSLMQSARRVAPPDTVPEHFVFRVHAALRRLEADPLPLWSAGLWRAALCAVAVALLAGAFFGPLRAVPQDLPDAGETEWADASLPDLSEIDPVISW
ncbi:MAG: hypothetical protein DVB31_13935 [Verrucomicrobia bacterium]|nr:MAG: hypothetical protein DVB31_13935 [Verrucomicrobiota bacterium]